MKQKLLRIGSMDYEPLPQVKKHTLDERLKEEMGNGNDKRHGKESSSAEKANIFQEKIHLTQTIAKIIESGSEVTQKSKLVTCLRSLFEVSEKV